MLLELRSTGQYTAIPPSIHPSGEHLYWKKAGQPREVQAAELQKRVRRLAACALMARHWPKKGSRHELTLALAGFLLRNGWSAEETKHFVTAASFAAMTDEEWDSRKRDVESTLQRLMEGKTATGIPKISAIVGEDVVSRRIDFLDLRPTLPSLQHLTQVSWPNPPRHFTALLVKWWH